MPVDPNAKVELGSSQGGTFRDINPALANRAQALQVYNEMSNSDVGVDISLRASKTPVMGADYYIDPFDDKQINVDIAEFVQFNLLEGLSAPFLIVLEDILRMYEHGFSVMEKVYELREWAPRRSGANRRVYTMLKKLSPRPAVTIAKFTYDDNGGPATAQHNAVRADGKRETVDLPIEKLIIFTNNRQGGNLEGKSLLRTAWKHWYYKENLYKIDGIQKERHGMGFPVVHLPPQYTPADRAAARELVKNVRTNEEGGAVLPPGFEFEFAKMEGQPVDVMQSINHHNGMIMLNVMVQFLLMGMGEGGGRATAGSHQDMFNKSLRYVANIICDAINLYLIPQLVAYNFDTDEFPRLRVRNIGETKDLQQWASAIANLAGQQVITMDQPTEQWVRNVIDAPVKLEPRPEDAPKNNNGKGTVDTSNPRGAQDTADPTNAEG